MKVLVTGSRHWINVTLIDTTLTNLNPDIVIHGGAKGADTIAGMWARIRGKIERVYPAQWDKYGKAAGTNRNLQMLACENLIELDNPIDCVVAFPLPNSIGTHHMLKIAKAAGVPCVVIGDPAFLKETDATQAEQSVCKL